jgi:hypothetical protein
MRVALILRHGEREDAPNEVMGGPHVELVASNSAERDRLKVLADDLRAFGSVPFMFKELSGTGSDLTGAVMRIGLCERPSSSS